MSDDNRALYEAATAGDLAAELETRGLPKSGAKPELVDRLLEHDAAQPTTTGPQPDAGEDADGEICGLCWPGGWPDDHDKAHCEHGEYTR
ncbi:MULTISPECIES: SAP domain-containing protein [Amycolatopsis]|uniref:SAP domain-containing protein n=1 Tax=Amycolatopsis albidoflavus TaxID=102226 RepID=A0ABW5I575_9PSEU